MMKQRVALVLLAASVCLAAPEPPDPRREAQRLLTDNEILKREVELASGDAFYLILDPSAATFTLMLKGAVLRRYHVASLEIGDPHVAFVSREGALDWQGKIWSGGNLVPARERDRIEVKAPPPGSDDASTPEPVVPPTPEEKYPVPPRYGLRFEGGLFLEVLPVGEAVPGRSLTHRIRAWWEDAREVVRLEPEDRLRLRISLRQEDSEALYRSLPPDTKLLVLPPTR